LPKKNSVTKTLNLSEFLKNQVGYAGQRDYLRRFYVVLILQMKQANLGAPKAFFSLAISAVTSPEKKIQKSCKKS
jgi:hypothetical protein